MSPCYFYPVIGGAETHVFHLSKNLVERGHQVFVLTSDCMPTNNCHPLTNREEINGIRIQRFKTFDLGAGLRIWRGLAGEILQLQPDVIHAHSIGFPHSDICALLSRIRRIPSIVTTHGALGIGDPAHKENVRRRIWASIVTRWTLRFFDRIILISPAEKPWVVKRVPVERICVIPNGVPGEIFDNNIDPVSFRKKYGLEDIPVILYLGRVIGKKGVDHLLMATPLILKKHKVKILIAGPDGGKKRMLMELSQNLCLDKDVIFTGELSEEDKLKAIACSDVLVLPSKKEAQGIVLLEAQAMGKPVIATRQGGIPYFIKDGENGILIDYGRPDQIANAVEKLLSDREFRGKIGKKGKETVRMLNWDVITQKILDVYESIIEECKNKFLLAKVGSIT
ncbi:MAG: glycosyltransferase family 4 protein [Candidatus Hydrothermarchaeota archaeon]